MSFDDTGRSGGGARVGFVAALKIECASLRRQAHAGTWQVLQSGPGATRAAAAATRLVDSGAHVLISWGLAGGLDAALVPGSVVAPRHVVPQGDEPLAVDAGWHSRLAVLGEEFDLHYGDLLTVPAALESPDAKRSAATAAHAVAVDMESAAIAHVAARARVRFLALRVIVDALDDALPRGAEQWIDERGNRRIAAGLRAVIAPTQWPPLVTLARRYRVATRVLERLASALVRHGVLLHDEPAPLRAGS